MHVDRILVSKTTLENWSQLLRNKIEDHTAVIGVIGLGYVGLPLIKAFINRGFRCVGFDIDSAKVDALNAGRSYIKHIPSETIADWIHREAFTATTDMWQIAGMDAILICVPTPLNDSRDPDLSFVESTTMSVCRSLRAGQLIVLESTTYPTTTRNVVVPMLNSNSSGLKSGVDFFVAYSPEREDPGNASFTAASIPKVVGGADVISGELASALYSQAVVSVVPVASAEIAEACKILENTYRSVNIALVNELKTLFDRMGIDVWAVIEAAKTKPFGFQAFYPGPGLGGHCIPIDPFYLSWLARKYGMNTRFIELAGEVNSTMPNYVIARLTEFLNTERKPVNGSKVCLLGLAYKKDIDDPRESPSFELLKLLMERGAIVSYSDPHVPVIPKMRHYNFPTMQSSELSKEFLQEQDCVLISTDHTAFDYVEIVKHAKMIVDTRNACAGIVTGSHKIRRA